METTAAADDSDAGNSTGAQVWEPLQKTKRTVPAWRERMLLAIEFMIFPVISLWPSHGPDWLSLCLYVYFTVLMARLGGREAVFATFYWWTIKAQRISELCLKPLGKTVSEKKN